MPVTVSACSAAPRHNAGASPARLRFSTSLAGRTDDTRSEVFGVAQTAGVSPQQRHYAGLSPHSSGRVVSSLIQRTSCCTKPPSPARTERIARLRPKQLDVEAVPAARGAQQDPVRDQLAQLCGH